MFDKEQAVTRLIEILSAYVPKLSRQVEEFSKDYSSQRILLRGLMNMHSQKIPLSSEYYKLQDELLQYELKEKKLVSIDDLKPVAIHKKIRLYKGDITNLKVDAIVNAANATLLGCFSAGHACIDNSIHSAAGLQLRFECAKILREGNTFALPGSATLTKGFNLPSPHVIHVVGPRVSFNPTADDFEKLSSCYTKSLDICVENGFKSIAFCCVSTGTFGFPNAKAAKTAIDTVLDYLNNNKKAPDVIFTLFKDVDQKLYEELTAPKKESKEVDMHPFFNEFLF
ncbi:MAG: protein-ADP-ribose hydrolase [Succinivibrio sp.]